MCLSRKTRQEYLSGEQFRFTVRPLSWALDLPVGSPRPGRSPLRPGPPRPGLPEGGAAALRRPLSSCLACGPEARAEPPPGEAPPRPRPSGPQPSGSPSAPAPPLPARPRRACACAIASECPDRDGGRFGVAAARRGVGRSRCAVDRAQRPEFGGNSADTPPRPDPNFRGKYHPSRCPPPRCLVVSPGRVRSNGGPLPGPSASARPGPQRWQPTLAASPAG